MTEDPLAGFSTAPQPPATGRLLVAAPVLADPNFAQAVVLLLDHDDDGSLGVVLNRPTAISVASVLPAWADAVVPPEVLFEGGPVSTDAALAVGFTQASDDTDPVGFRRLFGPTGIVDLDTPPEVLVPAVSHIRVFAGYAGWGSGQLDAEIEEGSWYVVESTPDDVFHASPAGLWSNVLRRQRGELAWVSTKPVDPTLN